jgi:cell division protein FtsI/penicillin-binding protein 2
MTLREILNNIVEAIKDKEAGWNSGAISLDDVRNILRKKVSEDTETIDYLNSFGYELGCVRYYMQTCLIIFRNNLPYGAPNIILPEITFTRYKKDSKYFWKGYKVKHSEDLDKPLIQLVKENKDSSIDESYRRHLDEKNTADSILGKLSREDRDKLLEILKEEGQIRGFNIILNSLEKI